MSDISGKRGWALCGLALREFCARAETRFFRKNRVFSRAAPVPLFGTTALALGLAASVAFFWPIAARPEVAPSQSPKQVVAVLVHSSSTVSGRDVLVGDVATVQGGDPELRQRIAQLDLAGPVDSVTPTIITRGHILIRILIGGLDSDRFVVRGSSSVRVSGGSYEVSGQEIFTAAKEAVLARLPWAAGEVQIEPAGQLPGSVWVTGASARDVQLQATLPLDRVSLGRLRVNVGVYVKGALRKRVPIILQVQIYQQVPLTTRPLNRGQLIRADDVYLQQRLVSSIANYPTRLEIIGKRARRTLDALQPIRETDLAATKSENPVMIRRRDHVQLVARKGSLLVTALGEALQSGQVGELIRVRNVRSKIVVLGRVLNQSEVEVRF